MRLHLSASGVTTFAPDLTSPPDGYIWKIEYAYISLKTGTGTGTRYFQLYMSGILGNAGEMVIVNTGDQTGTSTTYVETAQLSNNGNVSLFSPLILDAEDVIGANITLVTGDTIAYDIQIDQVIDE